ncbi:MAG: acyl-CoA dehydrogenase family protein [Gemmatimonadales bacterium]
MNATATREEALEQDEIVALAHELGRRELAPLAPALDERRPAAVEAAWGRLTAAGFDRALLPAEAGGAGLQPGSLLACLEELGAGEAGMALAVLLSNAALAGLPAERAAQVEQGERWTLLPAPPRQLATPARVEWSPRGDGRAVLTGTLSPALGAFESDGILVVLGGERTAVLALERGGPGIRFEACESQLGLRAAAAARISFEDAAAESHPQPGEAAAASLRLLRAGSTAIARGVARRAHELALAYARTRQQGGVTIVEHDAVRQMLAAMEAGLARGPASSGVGLGETAILAARMAATDAAVLAATDAVQVCGGTGYMCETGVEKLMRDAMYLKLWPEPAWIADDAIVDAALQEN